MVLCWPHVAEPASGVENVCAGRLQAAVTRCLFPKVCSALQLLRCSSWNVNWNGCHDVIVRLPLLFCCSLLLQLGCVETDLQYVAYERPALSKAYLFPQGGRVGVTRWGGTH